MSDFKRWMLFFTVLLLGWLVYALQPILMPFMFGAILAYLINPVVLRLTRLGMRRSWAVSLSFITMVVAVVVALVVLGPMLWRQGVFLESKLPSLLRWANARGIPWLEVHLHVQLDRLDMAVITQWISGYWSEAGDMAKDFLPRMARSGIEMASFIGMTALVPVVTFYLLLDWDQIMGNILDLIPRRFQPLVTQLARECDEVLAAFFRGQLLVMLILGVVYAVGLEIVGLNLGLMIGMIAGLGSIVPYFGFAIGIVSATIVALFQFGGNAHMLFEVWLVFGIGQIIEGWVLQPFLLGDRIGLPPVAVIFSVMAGGTLFGFFGMLVALPVAAIIMVLLRHAHGRYRRSSLYQQWPPAAPNDETQVNLHVPDDHDQR
jgi:predicted PurR-regulated permease PerM